MPGSFVVKNGSKSRLFVSASMPWPVSYDAEHHVVPGVQPLVGRRVLLVDVHVRRLDRQLASVRHRVARVDDEVHEHLLDLTRVGLHAPERAAEDGDDLDVLADQAAQHLVHLADDVVQLQDPRLEKLLPAEREQLAGQRAGSVGRLGDLLDVLANARRVLLRDG